MSKTKKHKYDVKKMGLNFFAHPTSMLRVPIEQLHNYSRLPYGYVTYFDTELNDLAGRGGMVAGYVMQMGRVQQPKHLDKYNPGFFLPTVSVNVLTMVNQMFPGGNQDIDLALSVLYPYTEEYGVSIGEDIKNLLEGIVFVDEINKNHIHISVVKTMYETRGGILCWEFTHSQDDAPIIAVVDIGGGTTEFAMWNRETKTFAGKMARQYFGINDLIGRLGRSLFEASKNGQLPATAFTSLPTPEQVQLVLQGYVDNIVGIDKVRDVFLESVRDEIEALIKMSGSNIGLASRTVTVGGGGTLFGGILAKATGKHHFLTAYEPDPNLNHYSNAFGACFGIQAVAERENWPIKGYIALDIGNALTKVVGGKM